MKLQLPVWAILLILIVPGCGGNSPGVGVYSTSWSVNESGTIPVNGLDDAQVMIGKIDDDPVIIIWADCGGSFGGQAASSGRASFQGTLRTDDGREVSMEMKVVPGRTGNVVIDGQSFDPVHGTFFLVSTLNAKTRVRQLNRTLPALLLNDELEDKPAEFRKYASADSDITAFYAIDQPGTPSIPESPSADPAVTP